MATRVRTPKTSRHTGALLEEVRSQQSAMLEAIASWGERLERTFTAELVRVNERLANLEAAVRQNSEDIRKNSEDIRKNSEDIRRLDAEVATLREEVRRLRTDFDARAEKSEIAALEMRVARLEQHLKVG